VIGDERFCDSRCFSTTSGRQEDVTWTHFGNAMQSWAAVFHQGLEKEKKRKYRYLEACLKQRRHCTPFVIFTDGLIGEEAKTVMRKLSKKLAGKWRKPNSEVRLGSGYASNARMSIAIVRATHRYLRGSRVPTSRVGARRPQWEDQAGLSLFRH
jgi:hypothetical protein